MLRRLPPRAHLLKQVNEPTPLEGPPQHQRRERALGRPFLLAVLVNGGFDACVRPLQQVYLGAAPGCDRGFTCRAGVV